VQLVDCSTQSDH